LKWNLEHESAFGSQFEGACIGTASRITKVWHNVLFSNCELNMHMVSENIAELESKNDFVHNFFHENPMSDSENLEPSNISDNKLLVFVS
jgi:hypothetical protein